MKTCIERFSQGIIVYPRMTKRYGKMFAGKGYAHRNQDSGKHFVPGRVAGDYIDLTGKVEGRVL
jgi:hypothetical protein